MSARNLSPNCNRSSTSTYEMRSNCNPEKDMLISQLKTQVFEYEQNEKNFHQLQSKFRNLQNDLQLLSEEKLGLEYELKQKTESGSQSIAELKKENEDILNELNDKIAMNKKLYFDNNNLFKSLESKTGENADLKEQLHEQEGIISKLNEDKNYCERQISSLNQNKDEDAMIINEMEEKNDQLKRTTCDQNGILQCKKEQNDLCLQELDGQRFDNKNLVGKLKSREENLCLTQRELQDANRAIVKLENDLNELKKNYTRTSNDLAATRNSCANEQGKRNQIGQSNDKLDMMIKDRCDEIKRISNENDAIKMNLEKLGDDKSRLGGELEQYKGHIKLLIEQNQKLADELEFILQRDQKLYMMLNRNIKNANVVEQNRVIIENSLENLKQYLSSGNNCNPNMINKSIDQNNSTLHETQKQAQGRKSPSSSINASQNFN